MGQSAFLPDSATLDALFRKVRAEPRSFPSTATSPSRTTNDGAEKPHAAPGWQQQNTEPDSQQQSSREQQQSTAAGSSPSRSSEPTAPDLEPFYATLQTATSLDQCFQQFVLWLQEQTAAEAVFIADGEGLPMVDSAASEGYLAAAGQLGEVLGNLSLVLPDVDEGRTTLPLRETDVHRGAGARSAEEGRANHAVGAERHLELVWCGSELGRFTVGLIREEPLPAFWIAAIRTALRYTAAHNPRTTQ